MMLILKKGSHLKSMLLTKNSLCTSPIVKTITVQIQTDL